MNLLLKSNTVQQSTPVLNKTDGVKTVTVDVLSGAAEAGCVLVFVTQSNKCCVHQALGSRLTRKSYVTSDLCGNTGYKYFVSDYTSFRPQNIVCPFSRFRSDCVHLYLSHIVYIGQSSQTSNILHIIATSPGSLRGADP